MECDALLKQLYDEEMTNLESTAAYQAFMSRVEAEARARNLQDTPHDLQELVEAVQHDPAFWQLHQTAFDTALKRRVEYFLRKLVAAGRLIEDAPGVFRPSERRLRELGGSALDDKGHDEEENA